MLKNLGPICLAIWLFLMGLDQAMGFRFPRKGLVLGILAIIAGATMLLTLAG
jgi:hypothetical protein